MPDALKAENLAVDLMIESAGGGSMRHVMDLYDALSEKGHDVRLIISTRRAEQSVMDWLSNIEPERLVVANTHRSPHVSDIPLISKLREKLHRDGRTRILHAHSTKAGILSAFLKDKVAATVLTPHAYRGMDPTLGKVKKKIIGIAERSFSKTADHIIAVSPEEVEYARSLYVPSRRISYIPNGINIENVRRKSEKGRKPRKSDALIVGFVGRMTRQKNPLLFIETMHHLKQKLPSLHAVMVGDGDMMPEVLEMRSQLGLERTIEMLGAINFSEDMHCMDIMLHTSTYESLPYVLLEAGAGGVAVVTVRNAGSEAVWPNGNLMAPDPEKLSEEIHRLMENPSELAAARNAARAGAERFSISEMARSIEDIYRRVLNVRAG